MKIFFWIVIQEAFCQLKDPWWDAIPFEVKFFIKIFNKIMKKLFKETFLTIQNVDIRGKKLTSEDGSVEIYRGTLSVRIEISDFKQNWAKIIM